MRTVLVMIGVLVSATAYAQGTPQANPPMVGDRPLVQVGPKGKAGAKQPSLAVRLQACLEIEDESKERLNCYDALIPPKPVATKGKQPAARAVTDCKSLKEEDERLACFNGFVTKLPKT